MSQRQNQAADWADADSAADQCETIPVDDSNGARPSAVSHRAIDEAGHSIARELNGPLTALLLYIEEIRQHSRRMSAKAGERDHLQKVVENALQQTERVCALVKQIGGAPMASEGSLAANAGRQGRSERVHERGRSVAVRRSEAGQKPLTRREREVLNLISEGYSNKQGALRMQISPRTFESHRAEAMRKLGARNTAALVRAALLQPPLD